jgi:hypothetical protein
MIRDTLIVRTYEGLGSPGIQEFELPVAYKVEEVYRGSEEPDDPSHCAINERVKVLEDIGPFRYGDLLVLTADEQESIQEEALNAYRS